MEMCKLLISFHTGYTLHNGGILQCLPSSGPQADPLQEQININIRDVQPFFIDMKKL